jgi:hypothetical protein
MNEKRKNLPASIHRRLLNLARLEDRPLNELLQYYAIERFLISARKKQISATIHLERRTNAQGLECSAGTSDN